MAAEKMGARYHLDDDSMTDSSSSYPTTSTTYTSPASSTRSPSPSFGEESGMIHTPISVIHETEMFVHQSQMRYLKAYEEDVLKLAGLLPSTTPLVSPRLNGYNRDPMDMDITDLSSQEKVQKKDKPFVTTIPEIIIGIFKHLNPIDAVCLSLIKSFMPSSLTFCAGQCQKFTLSEPHDSKSCDSCGRSYRKQFERGRRMINVMRPEGRRNKWYEQPRIDRENRNRERDQDRDRERNQDRIRERHRENRENRRRWILRRGLLNRA
ncbi:hypothetical protein NHQ30_007633 [Ciborinia camelliae]|nr:hypothetical protein NHQ30_007633 [Ciborinia camelliae]